MVAGRVGRRGRERCVSEYVVSLLGSPLWKVMAFRGGTYMPHKRQVLEVHQGKQNRGYPPETTRGMVSCPAGQRSQQAASPCWLRCKCCDGRDRCDDANGLRHCSHYLVWPTGDATQKDGRKEQVRYESSAQSYRYLRLTPVDSIHLPNSSKC